MDAKCNCSVIGWTWMHNDCTNQCMGACPGQRRRAGFTLIEGLLAGVVLALVGVVIAGSVSQSMRAGVISRDISRAAELLDVTMTKVDVIGPDRLLREGPMSGRFDPPDDRFAWTMTIESLVDANLYAVELTVTWPGAGGQRSAVLSTRLNDPPGSRDPYLQWEALR